MSFKHHFWFSFLLLLTPLVAISSDCFAQSLNTANHVRSLNRSRASDEAYFDAEHREVPTPGSLAADKTSATISGNVLSLIFDTARLSLQSSSDPLVSTWVGTITVPTNAGAGKPRMYLQHVRGSVNKTTNTRVTIFFELGGQHFVTRFPYGMRANKDFTLTFRSPISVKSRSRYVATMMILAERRAAKDALLVDLASIDVDAR
jgi:hypothetical protein